MSGSYRLKVMLEVLYEVIDQLSCASQHTSRLLLDSLETYLVVADNTTVQGVLPIVLVLGDVVGLPVERESAVLDSVGVSAAKS